MPKVFISYCWTTQSHQSTVLSWADRLIADGVDVVIDVYDLKEGDDKYAFMERMVVDKSVTHVMVVCDKAYSEKADAKKDGVGTESQIISQEIYQKVKQSKFIPIVCEFLDDDTPFMPTFLKSRIWIDFSSPEAVNENWERLVRLIFGKPLYEKPTLGKPPVYVTSDSKESSNPAMAKFNTFRQALMENRKGLSRYRNELLSVCIDYADSLRVREQPNPDSFQKKVLEVCGKLKKNVRNYIIDWVLLESEVSPSEEFNQALSDLLEKLLELKYRPRELNSWNASWASAHSVFIYETFLYVVAALLKSKSYKILHDIFTSYYLRPISNNSLNEKKYDTFRCFLGEAEILQSELAPEGKRFLSATAELIKRQADRKDLPFSSIIEAELLILLMTFINDKISWYPQTLFYSSNGEYHFFIRAEQHKNFLNLAIITGINDADQLRQKVKDGMERLKVNQWTDFTFYSFSSFWDLMNMEKLDSLK